MLAKSLISKQIKWYKRALDVKGEGSGTVNTEEVKFQLTDDGIKETNQIVSCEGYLQRLLQGVLSKGVETGHPQRIALSGLGGAMTELQLFDRCLST